MFWEPTDELLEVDDELLEIAEVARLLLAGGFAIEVTGPNPWSGCDCEALPKPGIVDPALAAVPVEPFAGVLLELLPPVKA